MGATDPAKAAPATIRKLFADGLEANSVHGSDSAASAQRAAYPLQERDVGRSEVTGRARTCYSDTACLETAKTSVLPGIRIDTG